MNMQYKKSARTAGKIQTQSNPTPRKCGAFDVSSSVQHPHGRHTLDSLCGVREGDNIGWWDCVTSFFSCSVLCCPGVGWYTMNEILNQIRCYRRSSLVSRQLATPEAEPENNHFHIHRKIIIFALLQILEEPLKGSLFGVRVRWRTVLEEQGLHQVVHILENYEIDSETNVSLIDQDDFLNFESQSHATQEVRALVWHFTSTWELGRGGMGEGVRRLVLLWNSPLTVFGKSTQVLIWKSIEVSLMVVKQVWV
jgi:hypothetical protein